MPVSYEQAHAQVRARLSAEALGHSERVAATAAHVASLYGYDPEAARLAGLLHDWHRETPAEDLVGRARRLGLDVTEVDEAVPYLLHGPVAQADLELEFRDLPEDVLTAVGAHTYGMPDMAQLSMIVYIADVIEPARHQHGVDSLRSSAGVRPLEDLFAEAYAASLHHLIERRRRIHPQTVSTWNDIAARSHR
ncbi:MAG: bis(5'-nucleosyl)-tetraphosphatase (symmetrical) YqeK [Coriobacteriia bacterium]|nr:bis(5'-nucleosyl)-tetraphosphatase (symmetrical) YqeK [Coriobacteriia bacterium]